MLFLDIDDERQLRASLLVRLAQFFAPAGSSSFDYVPAA